MGLVAERSLHTKGCVRATTGPMGSLIERLRHQLMAEHPPAGSAWHPGAFAAQRSLHSRGAAHHHTHASGLAERLKLQRLRAALGQIRQRSVQLQLVLCAEPRCRLLLLFTGIHILQHGQLALLE